MSKAVAKRYAKALFEVASEKKCVDLIEKDLKHIADIFAASPELSQMLNHPAIGTEQKKELVTKVFKGLDKYTNNLVYLLIDRHRETVLPDIYEVYKSLANEAKGVTEAIVTTAFELTADDKEQLLATFEPIIGKKMEIVEKVDSDILGGVIVQIGDRLYDGSLRTKLNRFREHLKRTQVG
ncbi:F0F1 ATP synthase subunit delta [Thermoactinomyces mirandus]|uniref:ATP synthase subunit delta n=1 Tax=Thermoactinomyces mirandus TaxID=2756294 RepID=A0A7W2ARG5_9BACL|nr:F0F1 ATP synthase subunit delta [Thermoactinomyces mirandus]MBA4602959.1 F0F1 ATP synthase subunit delta [Thermoactinomyces mirandus]